MSGKEKFDYIWKIAFLALFCVVLAAAGIYTIFSYPLSVMTVIYFVLAAGGSFGCGLLSVKLLKEFKKRKEE